MSPVVALSKMRREELVKLLVRSGRPTAEQMSKKQLETVRQSLIKQSFGKQCMEQIEEGKVHESYQKQSNLIGFNNTHNQLLTVQKKSTKLVVGRKSQSLDFEVLRKQPPLDFGDMEENDDGYR